MKFLLTISSILLLACSATCQLNKKTWLAGGSGSFYSYNQTYVYPTTTGTSKYTDIDVSATIGYFLIDKLAAGLTPTFISSKGSTSGGFTTNGHQLAIGPFARYYFLNKTKTFNFLSEVNYQFGINKIATPKSQGKFNRLSFLGGMEVFFNSTVGIELLLGYKTTTISIDNSSNAFSNINKGLQMSIGFQIHLEKD